MHRVYVSYNNIISSLGSTSRSVVDQVQAEISGISLIDDNDVFKSPFYGSMIDSETLQTISKARHTATEYTRLEQLMIASLYDTITASELELTKKVGLIISTTKGNIDVLASNSSFNKERAYLSVLGEKIRSYFNFKNEAIIVSSACVSGLLSVAIAKRYLTEGLYDHVFIVSGDIMTEFVVSGFNSFQALSNEPCKPYAKNRSGINLGEAVASVLVTTDLNKLADESVMLLGESSCNDANHISGPSRTGEGLYRSIQNAMTEAQLKPSDIDYISAHGTATLFNDEMESVAFNRAQLNHIPLNSLKRYFGHTLGASGLLETIVGMHALHRNILFTSLGSDTLGVSKPINVIQKTLSQPLDIFLKTSSGFGGCNTAAIFKKVS